MKKSIGIAVSVLIAFAFIIGCGGKKGNVRDLKLSVTTSETSSWYYGAAEFKRMVEERTNGRFKISIYPNEQLASGDQTKTLEMLYQGINELDIHSAMIHNNVEPKLTACFMPWIFTKGYESVDQYVFNNGTGGQKIKELIAAKGAVPLALGENGFRQITNNKLAIHKPSDFKGMKFRVPSVTILVDLYKMLGADPVSMSFSEVFTALQQGTIDGQENPLGIISSSKLYEVQKFLTIANYSYDPIVLSASKKFWDSLSAEDQKIFQDAATEAMKAQVIETRKQDKELLQGLQDKGIKANSLTTAEIAAFQTQLAPLYKKYIDQYGAELFEAFGYKAK
ncbi:MAG: DctP family TRAP transporter solute-binding subunit [Elusimicrobiota bacterium]|jgi:tripartite ATP-independent transporter DctP family solute receptor|nr:DctP family TRAP transporter solute-binding subunit [Elusimicrobiota bacterium]